MLFNVASSNKQREIIFLTGIYKYQKRLIDLHSPCEVVKQVTAISIELGVGVKWLFLMFKTVQERINNQYKDNFTVNVFDGLMKNYSKDPGKK